MSFLLAVWSLLSTWSKAGGYRVSGRLVCGLDSEERGSLHSLFVFCFFDLKEPNCFCSLCACLVYQEVRQREGL